MTTRITHYHKFNYLGKRKNLLLIPLILATGIAHAEDQKLSKGTELKTVNVEAVGEFDMPPPSKPIGTKHTISSSTINKQGGAEQTNFHKSLSLIPGVDVSNSDPYGAKTSLRIRGKSHSSHGRIGETLEGLPVKGIGPGKSINIDLENMESISVSKGAIAANEGLGFGTDVGIIDLKLQRPKEEFGGKVKQSFGSYNFKRTFVRADSGNLGDAVKLFVSGSYSDADKWKGQGQSPDGNTSLTFGVSSTEQQKIQWEIFGHHTKTQLHDYIALSYDESKDLKNNYKKDFRPSLTGTDDDQYYDYNREKFETNMLFGKLSVPVSDNGKIEFKPYYSTEKGYKLFSGGTNKTIKWLIEHDTYGATFDYKHQFKNTDMVLGYWQGIHEPPGPPTSQKRHDSDNNLEFDKWTRLVKATKHVFKSPYLQLNHYLENTEISAGLRYMDLSTPKLQFYKTAGLKDDDYKGALAQNPDKWVSLKSDNYKFLLPNIGVTHRASESTTIRTSLGRNYNTPTMIGGSIPGLVGKGVSQETITGLLNSIKPQFSNNLDVGLNYQTDKFYIAPTLFYSSLKNKSDSIYDPDIDLTYTQNRGQAISYGFESAMGYHWSDALSTSFSLTYNKFEYTKNIPKTATKVVEAKGNQIPNTPKIIASATADWNITNDVILSPTVHYTGKRYADVLNENSVNAHTLVDLSIAKAWKLGSGKTLSLQSQLINVFDKHYISDVTTPNDATPEIARRITSNYYYVGAPRTFTVSVQLEF